MKRVEPSPRYADETYVTPGWLRPTNADSARKMSIAVMLTVAGHLFVVGILAALMDDGYTVLPDPASPESSIIPSIIIPAIIVVLAYGLHHCPERFLPIAIVGQCVMWSVTVMAYNVISEDTSLSGTVFYLLVCLVVADQWSARLSAITTAAATLCMLAQQLLLYYKHLPPYDAARPRTDDDITVALVKWLLVTVVLVCMSVALAVSRNSHETAQADLRVAIAVDSLTGLASRQRFKEVAQEATEIGTSGGSLLVLDVDRFKAVNDTYGHPAGDTTLTEVAAVFAQTIGRSGTAARLGGDEFAAWLPTTDATQAAFLARQLSEAVASHQIRVQASTPITVTVSIGTATSEDDTVTVDALYRSADAALYQSKAHKRRHNNTVRAAACS